MADSTTWVIIPVHNRRAITLACLHSLIEQGVPLWARIVVVDDGSTDGTSKAVLAIWPNTVVLHGDGSLWWTGAIRLGMEHAWRMGADHIFWLNDDCQPLAGAMETLLRVSRERHAITVAPCALRETGELHYGGQWRTRTGLRQLKAEPGELVPCEVMNGNCVCIPRAVIDKIGFTNAADFPHVFGDGDYALRANQAGFSVLLVGDARCLSTYGTAKSRQSWLTGEATVPELWKQCLNPQSGPLARSSWLFRTRNWGVFGALDYARDFARLVVVSIIRSVLPMRLIRHLAGQRSQAQALVEAAHLFEASH